MSAHSDSDIRETNQETMDTRKKKKFRWNNIFWIIFLMILLYFFLCGFLESLLLLLMGLFPEGSPAMEFINGYYMPTILSIAFLVIYCLIFKKNRFILRSFLPKGRGKNHKVNVVEDTYEPSQENTVKNLLIGLLLGFLTNFICILCALLHGDIKLYLDFSHTMIPTMIYALLMVFIQSTSEELWCRGFMYERICIHYPLWVAILANGIFFGLLHIFNEGVSVLGIVDIVVCGLSYSLVRWYTGSIWMVMGIHTMWNFTQNFLFGLPNSGLVSEISVFHLDAANGVSNLIYNFDFGVEGAIPAIVVDCILGVVCLILAKRDGRLKELRMSYEKKADFCNYEKQNTPGCRP